MVYVGSPDTYLHALDVETGQEKWRFNTKSGVASSPAVTEGGSFSGASTDTSMHWSSMSWFEMVRTSHSYILCKR